MNANETYRETETMPTTLNGLMNQAADALEACDGERLEVLRDFSQSWLQDDESTEAQTNILNAMMEAAYQLED